MKKITALSCPSIQATQAVQTLLDDLQQQGGLGQVVISLVL